MEFRPLEVSELNSYIKKILISDPILNNIGLKGEISNLKFHSNGNMYFTMKDKLSSIKCIMFSQNTINIKILPQNGMSVIANGYVSVYEKGGNYQLHVKSMELNGIGQLYVAYENLKNKLEQEGLFDLREKKSLPVFPKKVGLVTSITGAAIKDMISVINRRLPSVMILVYPVLVQGQKAHIEISKGLRYFNTRDDIDLIITGRGGGSIEELWAFNEEEVARVIFESKIPVITAVGHETDYTIADFVADLRAPTPSAAGELAVPNVNELYERLTKLYIKLKLFMSNYVSSKLIKIEYIKRSKLFTQPSELIKDYRNRLHLDIREIDMIGKKNITNYVNKIEKLMSILYKLNPYSTFLRGYVMALDNKGKILKSTKKVKLGQNINLLFRDGKIKAKAINVNNNSKILNEYGMGK